MSEINLDESMDEVLDEIKAKDEVEEVEEKEEEKEEVKEEPKEEEKEEEKVEEEPEKEVKEEPKAEYKAPPSTWKPSAKAKWDKLDPEIKEEVLRREADSIKGVQMLKEKADYGDRLDSTIKPYQPFLASKNVSIEGVVKDALNLAYSLETAPPQQKAAILMNIAQQYGADMTVFKGEIPKIDPVFQRLQSLEQQILQQRQQEQQRAQAEVDRAIQSFSSEMDNGKPRYPYLSNVETEMVHLIPAIRQREPELSYKELLVKAYDEAVWTNPETRQLMLADKARQESVERQERQKDIQRKAEKANKSNLKQKSSYDKSSAKPLGSIDDTMNETLASLKS